MSAQRGRVTDPERIIKETFREAGYADGWTETVLADYVHGLAEKIREDIVPDEMLNQLGRDRAQGMRWAADLIDPEVSTDA
ncbi:hypothetical protein [Streptomyces sp. enrichment culture]|uniref:hypothetical protein n=1 Tax=Streptomyces sp. enrichment culture TaxID=1795815 RepID=UPI003F548AB5